MLPAVLSQLHVCYMLLATNDLPIGLIWKREGKIRSVMLMTDI